MKEPRIECVIAGSGPNVGTHIDGARAGDVLRIMGEGFAACDDVHVVFDEVLVQPYRTPRGDGELLVTAPLSPTTTKTIKVCVGEVESAPRPFSVVRPSRHGGELGEPTGRLFAAIDEYAALAAAAARAVAFRTDSVDAATLRSASAGLDGLRMLLHRCFETWMAWEPIQAELTFEPMRTIEFYDDAVVEGKLVELVTERIDATFGAGSPVDDIIGGGAAGLFLNQRSTFDTVGDALSKISVGDWGFLLHEGVKLVEGLENLFKVLKPSAEAGAGVANADVELSLGEIFSAIAKLLDIVAQVLQKFGADASGRKRAEQIEAILSRLLILIDVCGRAEQNTERLIRQVEQLEEKADRIETEGFNTNRAIRELAELLGRTLVRDASPSGWIVDPRQTRVSNPVPDRSVEAGLDDIEEKVDRLEVKADRQEEKTDRQEEKLDRQEEKLDRLEEKADRQEEKLDRQERPAPPHEMSVAAQRSAGERVSAATVAIRSLDGRVWLRAAIDVERGALGDEPRWTQWVDFDRPQTAAALASVSIDLQYEQGSDVAVRGLLSTRDVAGRIFHRELSGADHSGLPDPAQWGDWADFLKQP